MPSSSISQRARTFSTKDFAETRDGVCRLASSLAQELAPTMAQWAKLVAPFTEGVARRVARLAKEGLGVTAPIGTTPSQNRARVKVRLRPIATPATPKASRSVPMSTAPNACRSCGAKLTIRKRLFCDQCLPDRRREVLGVATPAFNAAGLQSSQLCGLRPESERVRLKLSAAEPIPLRSSAKPALRGVMTARSMAWISSATFCQSWRASGARDRPKHGRESLARLEGARRQAGAA